jgi:hypothetical protein
MKFAPITIEKQNHDFKKIFFILFTSAEWNFGFSPRKIYP